MKACLVCPPVRVTAPDGRIICAHTQREAYAALISHLQQQVMRGVKAPRRPRRVRLS